MRLLVLALVILSTFSACASSARLPPAVFAETADVLQPGHVDITAAAGGGGGGTIGFSGAGGGGEARVRVGVGGQSELGIEASARSLIINCDAACSTPDQAHESQNTLLAYNVSLSWKRALAPHVALLALLGGTTHSRVAETGDIGANDDDWGGLSADAAIGLVASEPLSSSIDVYAAGRLAVAVRITADTDDAPPVVVALDGAAGLAIKPSPALRLYLEGGVYIDGTIGAQVVAGLGLRL